MAEDERLTRLIVATQDVLQPLIAKPKLTEKLLSKPPFRFLHDIVTNLNKATGFAEGLYTPEEMDSANIQEKQQKLDFLDKIINCVGISLGSALDVRPSKIVAGLEPENTNIWLQALAQVASDPEVDVGAAVMRTLNRETPGTSPAVRKAAGAAAKEVIRPPDDGDKEYGGDGKAAAGPATVARRESLESRRGSLDRESAEAKASSSLDRSGSSKAAAPGAAFTGPPPLAKNLDAQIEACNGDLTRTKEMLERLITRPKPTEKLLTKPPFRFLHDIITEVTGVTGFGAGLFDQNESDSSKVTEKGAKINYLEKIIQLVGMHLNTLVEARPSKVVAGLEPENTNRFLQLLVVAATELPDTTRTVRLLLEPGSAEVRSGASAQAVSRQESTEDDPSAPSKVEQATAAAKALTGEEQEIKRAAAKESATRDPEAAMAPKAASKDDVGPEMSLAGPSSMAGMGDGADTSQTTPAAQAPAAFGVEEKRSMRPRTARQRPPKVKDNVKEVDATAAGKAAPKSSVVIMREGDDGDKSEDEGVDDDTATPAPEVRPDLASGKTQHGKLVQDIIKEQKKEDEARRKEAEEEKKSASDGGIRLGRLKKGAGDSKSMGKLGSGGYGEAELETLRASIQVMCQSTNPLGKCMDYVHEDLSIMSKEHEKWQVEYRNSVDVLEEQKKVTEEEVQSLRLHLMELDEQVRDHHQKINSVRCSIAKNDERIEQLLRIVVSPK